MTNPGNSIGTNGAYGGRTSVNALNDVLSAFPGRGVLSGWKVAVSDSDNTLNLGGTAGIRDVAIAMDNLGNKTTVNNIAGTTIKLPFPGRDPSKTTFWLVVLYVDSPPQGSTTQMDNPQSCGAVVIQMSTRDAVVSDSDIRAAITADGASGTTAYYVELVRIQLPSSSTTGLPYPPIYSYRPNISSQPEVKFRNSIYTEVHSVEPSKSYSFSFDPNPNKINVIKARLEVEVPAYANLSNFSWSIRRAEGTNRYECATDYVCTPATSSRPIKVSCSAECVVNPAEIQNGYTYEVSFKNLDRSSTVKISNIMIDIQSF